MILHKKLREISKLKAKNKKLILLLKYRFCRSVIRCDDLLNIIDF